MPNETARKRLRLISVLLLVLAASSLALMGWRELKVRRDVFTSILQERAETTAREYDSFFGPVQEQLTVIRGWGEQGALELGDAAGLNARFTPVVQTLAWPAFIAIAGGEGLEYELRPADADWQGTLVPQGGSDLRRTDWYVAAIIGLDGRVHWSARDRGEPDSELVGSIAWKDPAPPHLLRVAALGVSRAALGAVVHEFRVTEHGMVAIISDDTSVYWHMPEVDSLFTVTEVKDLLDPVSAPQRLIGDALYVWNRKGAAPSVPYRFRHDGKGWWGWRGPVRTGQGSQELLFLLPETDLSARLMTVTSPLTYALLLLFGVCVVMLVRLTQGIRGRLDRITLAATHTTATGAELRALIDSGEGDHLEFKSTLRFNLKENHPGKEIELAWLKSVVAFLNTQGGTVLIGVTDSGKLTGIEPDGFPNADKYLLHVNNLVQQHIGVEFARYLRYDLRPIEGRHILVMDVSRSDEPVFLRTNEDDLFYVRMGPASRRLSLRKTLEYLKDFDER